MSDELSPVERVILKALRQQNWALIELVPQHEIGMLRDRIHEIDALLSAQPQQAAVEGERCYICDDDPEAKLICSRCTPASPEAAPERGGISSCEHGYDLDIDCPFCNGATTEQEPDTEGQGSQRHMDAPSELTGIEPVRGLTPTEQPIEKPEGGDTVEQITAAKDRKIAEWIEKYDDAVKQRDEYRRLVDAVLESTKITGLAPEDECHAVVNAGDIKALRDFRKGEG